MPLTPYHVEAVNTAKASENKIHDDATAMRFGFKGGFVGGVNVYGYMAHQPVARWGRAWLERGTGEAKFAKPVYEGDIAEVSATEDADGLSISVQSGGVLCATGRAALPDGQGVAPSLADYAQVAPRAERLPADEQTLRVGDWLGMEPLKATPEWAAETLHDLRETETLYAREGIIHPGTTLRFCNLVLTHNVVLPAWIHMGSSVRNLGPAHIGHTLNVRARITRNYEHKGHKWVELDCLVVANETIPVIQVTHTAIYRPRQLAEAA
jgi:acyl dehydratase